MMFRVFWFLILIVVGIPLAIPLYVFGGLGFLLATVGFKSLPLFISSLLAPAYKFNLWLVGKAIIKAPQVALTKNGIVFAKKDINLIEGWHNVDYAEEKLKPPFLFLYLVMKDGVRYSVEIDELSYQYLKENEIKVVKK